MFRKLYNQARITGELEPDGPCLVVQGGVSLDPTAPDLSFVRTLAADGPTVYLPGSSLKGVVRAHAERWLATELGERAAEDPFVFLSPRRTSARKAKKSGDTPGTYQLSCPADRFFGSTELAGRFRFEDALPVDPSKIVTEVRWGVAIDRAKQSAKNNALFEQEAVTGGRFRLDANLENFPLWMLGLLLQCLRDLDFGLIRVGHAKSRGFGVLRLKKPAIEIRWPGKAPDRLEGAGAREKDLQARASYGLREDDWVPLPEGASVRQDGFFSVLRLEGDPAFSGLATRIHEGPWQSFRAAEKAAG